MKNWESKQKIMREKYKLKGKDVFIEHDLTKEEREVQRQIREVARNSKKRGGITKIGYRKLRIDETWYKWSGDAET